MPFILELFGWNKVFNAFRWFGWFGGIFDVENFIIEKENERSEKMEFFKIIS